MDPLVLQKLLGQDAPGSKRSRESSTDLAGFRYRSTPSTNQLEGGGYRLVIGDTTGGNTETYTGSVPEYPTTAAIEEGWSEDETSFSSDQAWVEASDHNHTIAIHPEPMGVMPELMSDGFVRNITLKEAVESYPHTAELIQDSSSKTYETQAGKAIQTYLEMAGKSSTRRSTRKGRKGTTKRRKSTTSTTRMSQAKKDLVGYQNPFPDLDARIPDGQVIASLPHRYVNVQNFVIPEEKTGHMLIYPGLDSGVLTFHTDNDGTNASEPFYYKFSGQESFIGGNYPPFAGVGINSPLLGEGTISVAGEVTKWRTVSQGLRMALVNNEESNGGWFETCHLHYKMATGDWELYSPSGNHTGAYDSTDGSSNIQFNGQGGYIRPTTSVVQDLLSNDKSFAETDGYRCGTLRSIAATAFTLPVFQGHHEFQELEKNYRIEETGSQFNELPDGALTGDLKLGFKPGLDEAKDIIDSSWDTSHDMIYIKIHPSVDLNTVFGTQLLVQHACNQEVVYDINSTLHKHMRPATAPSLKELSKAKAAKSGNMQGVVSTS